MLQTHEIFKSYIKEKIVEPLERVASAEAREKIKIYSELMKDVDFYCELKAEFMKKKKPIGSKVGNIILKCYRKSRRKRRSPLKTDLRRWTSVQFLPKSGVKMFRNSQKVS